MVTGASDDEALMGHNSHKLGLKADHILLCPCESELSATRETSNLETHCMRPSKALQQRCSWDEILAGHDFACSGIRTFDSCGPMVAPIAWSADKIFTIATFPWFNLTRDKPRVRVLE